MQVITMGEREVWDKVNALPIHTALRKLDIPLFVTFLAFDDYHTADGVIEEDGKTYLTIRLHYEQIKSCPHGAQELMKFLLLSQIRHLKHLDWYNLYFEIKKALMAQNRD